MNSCGNCGIRETAVLDDATVGILDWFSLCVAACLNWADYGLDRRIWVVGMGIMALEPVGGDCAVTEELSAIVSKCFKGQHCDFLLCPI